MIAMGGKENALTDRCGDATISCIVKRPSGEKKPRIEIRSVYPMKCPYCANLESKVVDSRPADEGASIRRRRECLACGCLLYTSDAADE